MCGINGMYAYSADAPRVCGEELARVRDSMAARGPHAAGSWMSEDERVGLGHRRLAIIDLSEDGNQPMTFGPLSITYNGEIYNYRDLRDEMTAQGRHFRTESDTEVILQLFDELGPAMLNKLRGMFALAIWNSDKREMFLARDPFGIKPLYYADDGNTFRFASQVTAILRGNLVETTPDPAGHVGFLLWGYVPEPFTLYKRVRQVPAGSFILVETHGVGSPVSYSKPRDWFPEGREGTHDLRESLLDTVKHHFVADVPVSVFLSSGRDSTTLLALASEVREEAIHAITLAYPEYSGTPRDESALASEVARRYRADHTIRNLDRDEFATDLESALEAMDQPSVDGINTFFVSKATAEQGFRVAISGLGGDELFGGYPSFSQVPRLARAMAPLRLLKTFARPLGALASVVAGSRSPKASSLFELGSTLEGSYLLRRGLFMPPEIEEILGKRFATEGLEELAPLERLRALTHGLPTVHAKVSAMELGCYMRNCLLRDSDWAGMAHSLEIRVPFVDVEFVRRIGSSIASCDPPTKDQMASTPSLPLPLSILHRRKTGFTVPIRDWMFASSPAGFGGDAYRRWARYIYATFNPDARGPQGGGY